jgi:CCR4-NOT complex subunit CAF16
MLREVDEKTKEEGALGATGNSKLGELVMRWLRDDLRERGPRSQHKRGPEGWSYTVTGLGGYGFEPKGGKDIE